MFVPNVGVSLRFCVNYWKLCAVTKRDLYLISCMDQRYYFLAKAAAFTTLSAKNDYWQVEAAQFDRNKTAFYAPTWTAEIFINAVSSEECNKNTPMGDGFSIISCKMTSCSNVSRQHRAIFAVATRPHYSYESILFFFIRGNTYFEFRKRNFFPGTIDSLGHFIRPRRSELALRTTDAVREPKPSTYISKHSSFHGLSNNFCHFLPSIALIAASLNNNVKKDQAKYFHGLTARELSTMHELPGNLASH